MLRTWLALSAFAFGLVISANGALAGQCDTIAGKWAGQMSGKFTGATSMTIKGNCRVKWRLPDGRTNNCSYMTRKGQLEYRCSLGSKGVVAVGNGRIVMENRYTAAKHGAYKVELSKVE